MAAHIEAAAAVHKYNAVIRLFVYRLREQSAKHVPVPPGLQHQRCAQEIIMIHQIFFLVHHGFAM